ncbi:MAG TPA: FAD-dependent monooxygenase [Amycolatopsis sp.]|jgi:2-polyprenyl-6-methoxyphenol hydroxylase-like FAD-dependent oxidoreductase|nr:FAD-dependent monooxygenase [Amycolatopsis sp.]
MPQQNSGRYPVLIVGGSLVGLSTAMFLAQHGVPAMTVERHPGTAIHPRAGHLHLRTLELMRSAGLENTLRRLSAERFFPNGGINAMHTLAGGEIATYIPHLNAGVEEFSPSRRLFVAQDALEPLLRERAEELGARLRYGAEVTNLAEHADGVTATVRDLTTGREERLEARYVVGADGNRSPIRRRLGIAMRGHGVLSHSATIYFRADCRDLLAGTELGVIYIDNEVLRGFFRFERSGTSGFLAVNTLGDPRRPGALDVAAGLTRERAAELVRAAIGVPGMAVEVDDVAQWNATAEVADSYRRGRIFLAGDAAHVVPPNGGFGGNTGIHDAHNLAWKLAMVVKGDAGEDLLATYDAERRPVGRLTIDQAYSRYRHRVTPELLDNAVPALVDDFTMEIGYRYHSSAVVAETIDDDGGYLHPREACGRPGTRAPHVEYAPGVSTLDLFGREFVLLTADSRWQQAAAEVALPLRVHSSPTDPARLSTAYGLGPHGAALVRPDGFVAWRQRSGADRTAALRTAFQSIVSSSPVPATKRPA